MSRISRNCRFLARCPVSFGLLLVLIGMPAVRADPLPGQALSLLARNCYPCHGPDADARQADLRLDRRQAAVASGVIDVANLVHSELIARITSTDSETRMPPPDSGRTLSAEQIEVLVQWVKQGADYQTHWAFVSPVSVPVPRSDAWCRNQIDAYLLRRMRQSGLEPSPEADSYTLIRRVYLALTGLPPTPEEADHYLNDPAPDRYERVVAQLLASKAYGERWARPWLDLARYSDTNGYEKDRPRSIWPYRDWVIRALNEDMPFDQFSIEQLAGDMLPHAGLEQRVATGFHRNTMLNEEGGIDPLEYRFYALVDRVATTGTIWMGLSIGCAQCHSHKYDPISHADYYRMMALLNNADEPDLILDSDSAKRRQLTREIDRLEAQLPNQFPIDKDTPTSQRRAHFDAAFHKWCRTLRTSIGDWRVATPTQYSSNLPKLQRLPDESLLASGDFTKRDEYLVKLELDERRPISAIRLEALPDERLPAAGPGRAYYEGRKGDFFLSEISISAGGRPLDIRSASSSYGKIAIGSGSADAANVIDGEGSTGWSTAGREGQRHTLVLQLAQPLTAQELTVSMLFERHFVAALGRFRFSVTTDRGDIQAVSLGEDVESVLLRDPSSWDPRERKAAVRAFARLTPKLADARKPIDRLKLQLEPKTTTMVFQERPADHPRPTFRHHRGEWLAQRERVSAGVPAVFPQLPEDQPASRLTFARWLVSHRNPLVARVVIDRAWRQLMGDSLVRSDGDFGTQADVPTHPELLDWLAVNFMERGWSQKQLHRMIVTSAAFRQQSLLTPALRELDPNNRRFARGPRYRVDAEVVRDIMLGASGLLVDHVGGPSVYPPQPASVTALAYGSTKWPASKGFDRYRRSLYTFSKRTAPFAAYATFDAPSGENCVALRDRSNTPLQALTLLNDEMYFELARELGAKAMSRAGSSKTRIVWMFRQILTRPPREEEQRRLVDFFGRQRWRVDHGELSVGALTGSDAASSEAGALVLVARVLLNLDETITQH